MSSSNIVVLLLLTANEGTQYEGVRSRPAILDVSVNSQLPPALRASI